MGRGVLDVGPDVGFWDPLGLSNYGSDRTQAWFKAAELKHSRVAMAATVGWITTELGFRWPGACVPQRRCRRGGDGSGLARRESSRML